MRASHPDPAQSPVVVHVSARQRISQRPARRPGTVPRSLHGGLLRRCADGCGRPLLERQHRSAGADLAVPESQSSGRVVHRDAREGDLATLVPWRHEYDLHTMGFPDHSIDDAANRDTLADMIETNRLWVAGGGRLPLVPSDPSLRKSGVSPSRIGPGTRECIGSPVSFPESRPERRGRAIGRRVQKHRPGQNRGRCSRRHASRRLQGHRNGALRRCKSSPPLRHCSSAPRCC